MHEFPSMKIYENIRAFECSCSFAIIRDFNHVHLLIMSFIARSESIAHRKVKNRKKSK